MTPVCDYLPSSGHRLERRAGLLDLHQPKNIHIVQHLIPIQPDLTSPSSSQHQVSREFHLGTTVSFGVPFCHTVSRNMEAEPTYTVFVRLPFPRGDFVDPPAVSASSLSAFKSRPPF